MHARKLLSLLLSALLAVTVLAGCSGRSDFSKEVVAAANNAQNTVTFKTDSQLTRALQDALADNVQTSDVRDAMAADQSLQALLTDGYRLDVFAVNADSAKNAAEIIAQNILKIIAGKKSEGKIAMVLANNGYYYAVVLTYQENSGENDDPPIAIPTVTDITVSIPENSVAGTLKLSDLTFTATYSDGTTQPINSSDLQYTCDPVLTNDTFQTAGIYTFTITYNGKTYTTTIEVEGDPNNPSTWEIDKSGTLHVPKGATTIGSAAFGSNSDIHTVDLTGTDITRIGCMAFSMCDSLETVILSDKIEYIGDSAFSGCTNLRNLTINGTSTIQIDANIFMGCENLQNITFGSNIQSIPSHMFTDVVSLETIDLGNISSIGAAAFNNCKNLETVLGSNLTTISSNAFSGCTSLTNIDLSHAENVEIKAFYNCGSLTKIDLSSIKTIGQQAFSMQYYDGPTPVITHVRFGEQVESISQFAFSNGFASSGVNVYFKDGTEEDQQTLAAAGFSTSGINITWHSYEDGDSVF